MIECLVCGEGFKIITPTHLRKHNLTTMEYKEQYSVECLWGEKSRKDVTGKNHHGYKPRITFNCEHCGKEKSQLPCIYNNREYHFCGITCANKWQATENNPNFKKPVEFLCEYCGKKCSQPSRQYNENKHHFCGTKCSEKWHTGKNSGRYKPKIVFECDNCKIRCQSNLGTYNLRKHHFCSRKCKSEWQTKPRVHFTCSFCGKELIRIEDNKEYHFCDQECYSGWNKGKNNPKYVPMFVSNCDYCGKEISQTLASYDNSKTHFCNRECFDKWHIGENCGSYKWDKVQCICDNCGKDIEVCVSTFLRCKHNFCGIECYSEALYDRTLYPERKTFGSYYTDASPDEYKERCKKNSQRFTPEQRLLKSEQSKRMWNSSGYRKSHSGENHPLWKGGDISYGPDWTNTLRESIRIRDNYTCQECGRLQMENDRLFPVHHIDNDTYNNNPLNLITLCRSCHTKVTWSIKLCDDNKWLYESRFRIHTHKVVLEQPGTFQQKYI